MTGLTEYGDVMINAYSDEWGRRKTDGLLEDGTKILIVGTIFKEVLDSLSVIDTVLRDKASSVLDSVTLTEDVLRSKLVEILDGLGLSDQVTIPSRALIVTDSVGLSELISLNKNLIVLDSAALSDTALVSKVLEIVDAAGLTELVEKIVAGAVKTRIFLIIGDIAIQLTGS